MGNRLKEEEKSERIIRSLLKLPENKRCINCNSLGPQYVCTTFLTFVCTNCSGVHREFTHRVKSVSMAKFNAEEVSALQAGGNERARQIYFKEWDPQYHSYPDGSNLHRLRDFIKHVYVDRKYTGERSVYTGDRSIYARERTVDKLPRLRLGYEESDESRKVGAYHGGSRSLHDEDRYERNYSPGISPVGRGADRGLKYYYEERRSPRYNQENTRSGGFKRNPLRFEIVDNRIREERKSVGSSTGETKIQSRAPDNKKNMNRSSSFDVRPVEEKVENVPPQISAANQKDAGSAHNHNIKSTSGHDGNVVEHKVVSLIDFNADSAESQLQQTPPPNNDNNWASFDTSTTENTSQVPFESSTTEKASQVPNANPLESLLLELSTPSSLPAINTSAAPHSDSAHSSVCINNMHTGGVSPSAPVGQMSTLLDATASTSTSTSTTKPAQPANGGPFLALPPTGGDTTVKVNDGQQLPSMQQDPSISFSADSASTSQHINTPVGASIVDSSALSLAPSIQRSLSIPTEKTFQSMLEPTEDAGSGAGSQHHPVETKYGMRQELPAYLFTARHSSTPAQASGWHTAPAHGMGYSTPYYPNPTPVPVFPLPARRTNPFDLNEEKSVAHSTHFPSMASLQGALPNVTVPPGLKHASSLPTHFSPLKAPQSPSNESMMSSQSPSFATAFSPSAYMGQQLHNNARFLRPQGAGGFGGDEAAFGSLSTPQQPFQQPSIRYPAPSNSETFSSTRGNPFG